MLISRPEFALRPIRPADAPALAGIETAVWRTCYRDILPAAHLETLSAERKTARWRDLLLTSGDSILGLALASKEDRLAGFLIAGPPQDLPPGAARTYRGEILAVYVLPEWQGRGYGRRLMAHAAEWLAGRDLYPPYLWIFSDHDRTRDFVESLGGRPIAGRIASIGGQRVARTAYGLRELTKQARNTRHR